MAIESINPFSGEVLETFPAATAEQCDAVLDGAVAAQERWRATSPGERAERLRALGAALREQHREHAEVITAEMGKPWRQALAEVEKSAGCCDHYAERLEGLLREEVVATDAVHSSVRLRPLGVVLAIMPWNYPFWQFVRVAVPALAVGNGLVLKHASNVPRSALALEAAFARAGLPAGLVANVFVPGRDTDRLIRDPRIAGVSLTGSEAVGRQVGATAGGALKPAVLELGGSDPFVVLDGVDIAAVAEQAAVGRTLNNGQSCIAAKRFVVERSIHDPFCEALGAAMARLQVGDPMLDTTDVGPLARRDLRDEVHDQVRRSVEGGATLVTGGEVPDDAGAFYPPTVLTGATPGVAAFDEEVFGPVAAVCPFDDLDDAVALANGSPYGLGSSIWGDDQDRIEHLRDRLEAGMVFVNGIVKSDSRLPFGGVKASGFGRELGHHGLAEFANVQTVWTGEPVSKEQGS